MFRTCYESDENVFIGAPNGSGNLVCAEFALLRDLENSSPDAKAVYCSPNEDLAQKVYADWAKRLGSLKKSDGERLTVVHLTGEPSTDLKLLKVGDVIIATADKWDTISRRWKKREDVRKVKLFIADDLHFIGATNGVSIFTVILVMRP